MELVISPSYEGTDLVAISYAHAQSWSLKLIFWSTWFSVSSELHNSLRAFPCQSLILNRFLRKDNPIHYNVSINVSDVTYLGVENLPEAVLESIRPSTCLITVMLANNETGIMFSVAHIGRYFIDITELNCQWSNVLFSSPDTTVILFMRQLVCAL